MKSVLDKEACARCRICCSFVNADVWEAPAFNEKEYNIIANHRKINSGVFEKICDEYRAVYHFENEKEILLCPCLDEEKGCVMGDDKPFECKLWPIRVFEIEGEIRIGVSKLCPEFLEETEQKLRILMGEGIMDRITEEIEKNPSVVREYTDEYILYH